MTTIDPARIAALLDDYGNGDSYERDAAGIALIGEIPSLLAALTPAPEIVLRWDTGLDSLLGGHWKMSAEDHKKIADYWGIRKVGTGALSHFAEAIHAAGYAVRLLPEEE